MKIIIVYIRWLSILSNNIGINLNRCWWLSVMDNCDDILLLDLCQWCLFTTLPIFQDGIFHEVATNPVRLVSPLIDPIHQE